jgi:predicted MFS family arabinose efflux permease
MNVGAPMHMIYVQYALSAIGLVPAMVFLVDFVARGLGAGAHLGSLFWILYGVGAMLGPPLYGFLADRLGPRSSLRLVLLVQAVAVAWLFTSTSHVFIGILTIVIGTFPPGMVPLFLARLHEAIPHDAHRQNVAWSRATIVFAACQATAAYSYSALFNASGGNHRILFLIAGIALGTALVIDVGVPLVSGGGMARRRAG